MIVDEVVGFHGSSVLKTVVFQGVYDAVACLWCVGEYFAVSVSFLKPDYCGN